MLLCVADIHLGLIFVPIHLSLSKKRKYINKAARLCIIHGNDESLGNCSMNSGGVWHHIPCDKGQL